MDNDKFESLIIDYIDNKLNAAERREVETELVNNPKAKLMYDQLCELMGVMNRVAAQTPSEQLGQKFTSLLNEEIKHESGSRVRFLNPVIYRVAAAVALLMLGVGGGYWISEQQKQRAELAAMRKEMEETRQLMLSMMGNDESASQRIKGLRVAQTLHEADDEIVKALVKTMNEDPNSNVRLAALEALQKFTADAKVRKILIGALSTQNDPIVQIALIQLLVEMKEKGVVEDLQKIVDDEQSIQAVKDEAYSGILRLS